MSCSLSDTAKPGFLAGLAAIIIEQDPAKPLRVKTWLEQVGRAILDSGCIIVLRPTLAETNNNLRVLSNIFDDIGLPNTGLPVATEKRSKTSRRFDSNYTPRIYIFKPKASWDEIANFLIQHPVGTAPSGSLNIDDAALDEPLTDQAKILLGRAFWNCDSLKIRQLPGGRSGADVFCVYAKDAHGSPLPYFVKLGDRKSISLEHDNYRLNVEPYIPFHLGPHLVFERCCLGSVGGILVGNFVDEAETLTRCAVEGRATAAIACLFDRTLRGWHSAATLSPKPLHEWLSGAYPSMKTTFAPRLAISKQLGATKELIDLKSLFDSSDANKVKIGPIHGDLHAANVCIRANDAIVIDFCAHRSAPLVYDAASLEASLFVDGFRACEKVDVANLVEQLLPLYECDPDCRIPAHPDLRDDYHWYRSAIRQIRIYGREMAVGDKQYAAALAVAFLVKATKDLGASEPENSLRAAAYVFAEHLLVRNAQAIASSACNVQQAVGT
jgi:hypothetical protein